LDRLKQIAKILEVNVSELFTEPVISEVSGFLEFDGEIHKITNLSDLESFVENIKNRNN
jgi:hypothetical protein